MASSKFVNESAQLGKLAGPIIVGQVGQNIISLVDTLMIGTLGAVALGASAFANGVYVVFLLFGIGILAPTAALFAKTQGQGQLKFSGHLLRHSLFLGILMGILIVGLLYIAIPFLNLFGQTDEVLSVSLPFYQIIILTIIPSLLYQAYKQFTDGIGYTKIGMYVMLIGVVVNVLGVYALLHGHWGFPRLELLGVAIATLIARSLMAVLLITYVHLHPKFKAYLEEPWTLTLDRPLLKYLLKLGVPNGFTYVFEVGAFSAAAIMMGWFGAGPIAAHQVALSLASTTFLIALGVGIASSIRVGYELGLDNKPAARYAGFTGIILGGIWMGVCAIGFLLLRNWLPTLYVNDAEVIFWAAQFFLIIAAFQVFDGIQAVAVGALRGLSDTKWPSLITFVAYWIFGLPIGYVLAFHLGVGPLGIWIGLLIGLIFVSTILPWRFHRLTR